MKLPYQRLYKTTITKPWQIGGVYSIMPIDRPFKSKSLLMVTCSLLWSASISTCWIWIILHLRSFTHVQIPWEWIIFITIVATPLLSLICSFLILRIHHKIFLMSSMAGIFLHSLVNLYDGPIRLDFSPIFPSKIKLVWLLLNLC